MSGLRTLGEAGTAPAMQPIHDAPSASTRNTQADWQQERLNEARGILADMVHHPDTLVVLACRVVCGRSEDATERTDALGLMRLLNAQHHTQRPTQRRRAAP
jgi:hypothetical protein